VSSPAAPSRALSRTVLLVEGSFNVHAAKTASCFLRYRPEEVVAILDSTNRGRTAQDVVGFGGAVPIVGSIEEALPLRPDRLLIGIAGPGGKLPVSWRPMLLRALEAGLDLWGGLHDFLSADPVLVEAARRCGRKLVDLRAVPDDLSTPNGSRAAVKVPVITAVGSDCNVGKMTVTWEIARQAEQRGLRYAFVATGQTGVLLNHGRGLAVDRVISDFVAGAMERIVVEAATGADAILVEGQGSLIHPFYSGVTLGLLHGSAPDALLLCHVAGRKAVRHAEHIAIPSLQRLRAIYEEAAGWIKPARVLGVSLATHQLDERGAREALRAAAAETGLPVEDTVRWPDGSLLDACERFRRNAV
jgi:uncharacterized NAD-dependent epimerase/dehydratase family protein